MVLFGLFLQRNVLAGGKHHVQHAVIIAKCKWDVWDSRRSQRAARDSQAYSLVHPLRAESLFLSASVQAITCFSEWFPCDIIIRKRIRCDHVAGSGFALTGQAQAKNAFRVIQSCPEELELTRTFGRRNELKLIFDNTTLSERSPDKLWKDITSSRGTSFSVHKADIDKWTWQKAVRFRTEWSHVFERENVHCINERKGYIYSTAY